MLMIALGLILILIGLTSETPFIWALGLFVLFN